jgi:hypothetical protein
MKKLLFFLASLCLIPFVKAENISERFYFTDVEAKTPIYEAYKGIYNHSLSWTGVGTRTSCTITAEKSDDKVTWAELIAPTDCTTNGTATGTGYTNYVRVSVTALTGTGNTLYTVYEGFIASQSLGTISVTSGTEYAAGSAKGTEIGKVASWSDGTNIWPASTARPFPVELKTGGVASGTVAAPSADILTVQLPNTDPCQTNAKVFLPISNTTSGVKLIALSGTTKVYICSIFLVSATEQNINLLEGTKTSTECDTAAAGLLGGATAATGPNLAAKTGFVVGTGGFAIAATATAGHDVCFFSSSTGQVSGVITYVQK